MILHLHYSWYGASLNRQTAYSHNIFPRECILYKFMCNLCTHVLYFQLSLLIIKKNYQYLTNGVAMCTAVTNPNLAIMPERVVQCCIVYPFARHDLRIRVWHWCTDDPPVTSIANWINISAHGMAALTVISLSYIEMTTKLYIPDSHHKNLMCIGPCIVVTIDERRTN
jgi:hypothetical protein